MHAKRHGLGILAGAMSLALLPVFGLASATEGWTSALPWADRPLLLHAHSAPALPHDRVLSLAAGERYLAVLGEAGISVLSHTGDAGRLEQTVDFDRERGLGDVTAMAWSGERLVALAGDATYLLDMATGERTRLGRLAAQRGGGVAPLPDHDRHVLVVVDERVHLMDSSSGIHRHVQDLPEPVHMLAHDQAAGHVVAVTDQGVYRWSPQSRAFVLWEDANGSSFVPEDTVRAMTFDPTGRWLLGGVWNANLFAIDLEQGRVHVHSDDSLEGVVSWASSSMAVDEQRDVLYVWNWNNVTAISPASDPSQWEVIGWLGTISQPALHAYRTLGRRGGLAYLPDRDHLLFGGQWGLSVLHAEGSSPLVRDEGFQRYHHSAEQTPGEGPFYDFLRDQKMRAIWVGSGRANAQSMQRYRRAGINTLFYNVYSVGHEEFFPPDDLEAHLQRISQTAGEHDLEMVIATRVWDKGSWNFSGMADYDYRPLIASNGEPARWQRDLRAEGYDRLTYPCYLDEGYWQRAIGRQMKDVARMAADDQVVGMLFELGDGFTPSNIRPYRDPCVCDHCWSGFLDEQGVRDEGVRQISPADGQRRNWLQDEQRWDGYLAHQRRELTRLVRQAREAAHEIAPDLVFMLALPEQREEYDTIWFFNAFINGLGVESQPVLVCSEASYATAFAPAMHVEPGQRMREAGQPVIFIPGLVTYWHTPAQLAERAEQVHRKAAGLWYFQGHYWQDHQAEENHYDPSRVLPALDQEHSVEDYVRALEEASYE